MGDKMKKKWILICVLLLITPSIGGCLNDVENETDGIGKYIIEVTTEKTNNQIMIAPFPAKEEEYISKVYNNLIIKEGHCNYNITNTSKGLEGFGLKIEFNSSFKLIWEEKYEPLTYLSLEDRDSRDNSSWYEENPGWWFYLEQPLNSSIDIYLRYEVDEGSVMEGYLINQKIKSQGWNRVNGKKVLRQD